MKINGKVHCFFEQSGTFKNEFIKLGIPAEDYDIQNNFGETDNVIDLFGEITRAYDGGGSIFDNITKDDLVMAFFPCIKFCNIAEYNQRSAQEKWRKIGVPIREIYDRLLTQANDRHYFYTVALKMTANIETRGLRMIVENPWHELNYTNHFWFNKPSLIDKDRSKRGDWFKKPTAYWFIGCEPTHGMSIQQTKFEDRKFCLNGTTSKARKEQLKEKAAKGSSETGLCSEERSLISPTYARNFICDFILGGGKTVVPQQVDMFDELEK